MAKIDLKKFCVVGGKGVRAHFSRPFSVAAWTYANNGWLCVRVPRRDDVPERPETTKVGAHLMREWDHDNLDDWSEGPRPLADPPDCKSCGGTGSIRVECADEISVSCPYCKGSGRRQFVRLKWENRYLNDDLLRQIAELPGLAFSAVGQPAEVVRFRFDGGEGLMMPMTAPKPGDLVCLDGQAVEPLSA